MKSTQADKILQALRDAGKEGVHPTYFIADLHIFQYTARLHDVRKSIGCDCRHDKRCSNKQHIINKDLHNGTTKYYFVDDEVRLNESMKKYSDEYQESQKEKGLFGI
ncbi:MAG TPA: hypothetical protein VNX68_16235 [Nitrosopumilaceae archaeon]|jgi:hypothetical protein|nr:hypothetical protein [Nitrosopumilaceae archaeon]